MNPPSPAGSRKTGHAAASDTHFAPSSCRRSQIVKPGCLKIPCWADDPRLSIAILKIVVIACYHAAMIWFIFDPASGWRHLSPRLLHFLGSHEPATGFGGRSLQFPANSLPDPAEGEMFSLPAGLAI